MKTTRNILLDKDYCTALTGNYYEQKQKLIKHIGEMGEFKNTEFLSIGDTIKMGDEKLFIYKTRMFSHSHSIVSRFNGFTMVATELYLGLDPNKGFLRYGYYTFLWADHHGHIYTDKYYKGLILLDNKFLSKVKFNTRNILIEKINV